MNFNLFISCIWMVCYCMANELQVKYVPNSETSDEHFILLDVHEIEKRQAHHMSTPSLPVETTPITNTKTFSSHKYYTITTIQNGGNGYWDELYNHTKHVYLSNNTHLNSAGIDIKFTMPFYGHNVSRIQLTTGGFIYMGPYVHPFLTHAQYVAPLMANFDTKAHNSEILYKEYNNKFIVVEWRNVQLNDENYHGQFTFQSKLFQNGTIMFIYKTVPVAIPSISISNHSVKIGVSDAFYYDFLKNGTRYRAIVRYHSVDIDFTMIQANTVVILDPLPTCNTFTGCDQCVSANIGFECSWCPHILKCSNGGLDWNLQNWYHSRCNETAGNTSSICRVHTSARPTIARPTTARPTTARPTTARPTTARPTTARPTTARPTTARPTTARPTTARPTTARPTTARPTTARPTTARPTTGKSYSTGVPTTTQKTSQIPKGEKQKEEKDSTNTALIVVPVVLILVIVGFVGGWMYYAYTRPNTASGQWLIKHGQNAHQLKTSFTVKFKRSDKCKLENEDIEIEPAAEHR